MKFLFTVLDPFLKVILNPVPVIFVNSKKSPLCIFTLTIPILGSLLFAPPKAEVPTKNGELNITSVAPLDVKTPFVADEFSRLVSVLLLNEAVYPSSVTLMFVEVS